MTMDLPILPPDRIDGAWMTRALAAAGIAAEVRGVTLSPVGTGQVADTARLAIDYAGPVPTGAPLSLIGKFPAANEESRSAAMMFNIYRNEALFYQRLAPSAGMRVPKPFLALFDEASHDFIVLLEDLGHLRPGDQMAGCTVDEARMVAREAARLHASHWQHPDLLSADWVLKPDAAWGFYTAEIMHDLWPGWVDRYSDRVSPEVFGVAKKLVENYARWNAPRPGPRAITHNDLRPDNMLFGREKGDPGVVVVDWQTMTMGSAATDLAYFIGGALDRETRRRHEGELVSAYFEELQRNGVVGYALDDLVADYRHLSFVGAVMAIGASMLVKQTERGDRMFLTMLERAAHHAIDLKAVDLL